MMCPARHAWLRLVVAVNGIPLSSGNALGLSEALVPMLVGFGCLTVAWLCVAAGLWRHP